MRDNFDNRDVFREVSNGIDVDIASVFLVFFPKFGVSELLLHIWNELSRFSK